MTTTLHDCLREDFLDVAAPVYTQLRIAAHAYSQQAKRERRAEEKAFLRLCVAAHSFAEVVKEWESFGLGLGDLAPEWSSRQRQLMEAAVDAYPANPERLDREQIARLIKRLKAAALAA